MFSVVVTDTAKRDRLGRPRRVRGLEAINALPAALTPDQAIKLVSAHVLGLIELPKERKESLWKLGEALRLWGARSEGVKQRRQRQAPPSVEPDTDST